MGLVLEPRIFISTGEVKVVLHFWPYSQYVAWVTYSFLSGMGFYRPIVLDYYNQVLFKLNLIGQTLEKHGLLEKMSNRGHLSALPQKIHEMDNRSYLNLSNK